MVVNTDIGCKVGNVEFVSYTGRYPNLCRGILTLKINGEEYSFGNRYSSNDSTGNLYPCFWRSGGSCGFQNNNYNCPYTVEDEWLIDYQAIPKQFQKYAYEIDVAFNSHVEYGCCGGCL